MFLYLNDINPRNKYLYNFEINGILFYEGNQEINNQVVLMTVNMVHSSQENHHNSSKIQSHFWKNLSCIWRETMIL